MSAVSLLSNKDTFLRYQDEGLLSVLRVRISAHPFMGNHTSPHNLGIEGFTKGRVVEAQRSAQMSTGLAGARVVASLLFPYAFLLLSIYNVL